MNTFDFTPEELDLNKRRQLSPRQRELLRTTARGVRKLSQTGVYVKIGFMVLGLCIILSMYLQTKAHRRRCFQIRATCYGSLPSSLSLLEFSRSVCSSHAGFPTDCSMHNCRLRREESDLTNNTIQVPRLRAIMFSWEEKSSVSLTI